MAKVQIDWPKNLVAQGLLSFPLPTAQSLKDVVEWRAKKGIPKPKFKDKIGGSLLLTQTAFTRAQTHLVEVYLPFVKELYKLTDGEKGIAPDLVDQLLKRAKKGEWLNDEGKPDMPIRPLKDKDKENVDDKYVGKLTFQGPHESVNDGNIEYAAILVGPEGQRVVSLDDLRDDEILPSSRQDETVLWWGANWTFRGSFRLNAYDTNGFGVSAYTQKLWLLPDKGMPVSNSGDADVLEDGDDWE